MFSLTLYKKAPSVQTTTVEVEYNREDDDDVPQHCQPAAHDAGAPRGRRRTADPGAPGALARAPGPDRQPPAEGPEGDPGLRRQVTVARPDHRPAGRWPGRITRGTGH